MTETIDLKRQGVEQLTAAVQAVLDLHKPEQSRYGDGTPVKGEYVCVECVRVSGEWKGWPCATRQAAAAKLL